MLAQAGDLRRAERTADAIAEADHRSTAWIELVSPLTEAGDRAGALRAAQRARESIAAVDNPGVQVRMLDHLVQVLVLDGYPADARRVVDRVEDIVLTATDPHDRDWAYASAVHALTHTGQFDRAEQLIPRIIDRSPRDTALLKLSVGLGASGDFDRGLRLADTITSVDTRSTAQGEQVRLMAEAGDFERARSTAATVASPSSRADALADLAGAMAAAGDRAGAGPVVRDSERVAATIEHPATRSLVRSRLVDELIDAGDLKQAEATALTAVGGRDSDSGLGGLARAMTRAGDLAGARRILARAEPFATSITEPDARAWALSSLAEDFLAAGAADDAVRLLVEATGTGPWYRTLSTAAGVAPHAVQALAEDILTEELPP
jgi:tetratricopeptide (TPR) repeat protein